tara:strand:- start:1454 stop:1657 length:204 start_codon:yes stop_codon:yes gene_type:complete
MPAKFKESAVRIGATRRKIGMTHFYLHSTPTSTLVEAVQNDNTRPKHKQKYSNELVKRGYDLGTLNQ